MPSAGSTRRRWAPGQEPEQQPLANCRMCNTPIHEGDDHLTIYVYRDGHVYYCRGCVEREIEGATFECMICCDEHVAINDYFGGQTAQIPGWYHSFLDVTYQHVSRYGSWAESCVPSCQNCGDLVDVPSEWDGDLGDLGNYCNYCRREYASGIVHEYNYVPPLTFRSVDSDGSVSTRFSATTPYLGVELEFENAFDHAEEIQDLFEPETVWLKRDGSLMDDGLELVTHPATFEWYMQRFPWDALGSIVKMGGSAYNTGTCGIHVHISSSAFTEAHLFKFLSFHFDNPIVCQTIGQRKSAQYCSWGGWLVNRPHLTRLAKKQNNYLESDRYVAVNLTEANTVELRYFKGNLSPVRVKKNLQWVDALYRYTKQVTAREVMNGGLKFPALFEWVEAHQSTYPDLHEFIVEREINRIGEGTVNNTLVDA